MYRETFCPPFAVATYWDCIDPTEGDGLYFRQNRSEMAVRQRQQQQLYEPQYVVAVDSQAQIRQQMQQIKDVIANV